MKIALFAYSRQGCRTARRILDALPEESCTMHTMERFAEPDFLPIPNPSSDFYGQCFQNSDALLFVGSCGIAVRCIAPHIRDKKTDPAVLCIDELGQYVIPILSGHIGGANELAAALAQALDANAVITTATDIRHRFSVDTWAHKNGFLIDDMQAAKAVAAEILEKEVPFSSDFPILTSLPEGIREQENGPLGICVTYRLGAPYGRTLRLVPKCLHLGIGCRKGISMEAVAAAVEAALQQNGIDKRAVKCAASIDLKQEESGLLDFCASNGWEIRFYSASKLAGVPGDFAPSEFVKSITGVDNVCERAALMGADRIVVSKTARGGVTVAVATEKVEVRFE